MTYNVFGGTLNPAQSNPILAFLCFCIQVSFITDDDEFNRDDELDDEFCATNKLLSPDTEFPAHLSDGERFKGLSRHSSVSADDEDEDAAENRDPLYYLPSTDADADRYDCLSS